MEYYIKDGELYHHGTKGMKWGRRRYQNPDGSLTALGRIRYGAGKAGDKLKGAVKGAVDKHRAKKAAEKESERIQKLMKKPVGKLTEAELAERTALAKKQKELRQIESDSARLMENGKTFAAKFGSKMLDEVAIPAVVSAGKSALTKLLTKKLEKSLGVSEEDISNSFELLKNTPLSKMTDAQVRALSKRYEGISEIKKGRNAEKELNGENEEIFDRTKAEAAIEKGRKDDPAESSGSYRGHGDVRGSSDKSETESVERSSSSDKTIRDKKVGDVSGPSTRDLSADDMLKMFGVGGKKSSDTAAAPVGDAKKSEEHDAGKRAAGTILSDEDKD